MYYIIYKLVILAPFSTCISILESKSKCNLQNIKMYGTNTYENVDYR